MTTSYLARYHNGEYEAVYNELNAFGDSIREQPLYDDACAVAQAMMERIRHNLLLVIERLRLLNYRFLSEQSAPPQPMSDPQTLIQRIREQAPPGLELPSGFWEMMEQQVKQLSQGMDTALADLKETIRQQQEQHPSPQESTVWHIYMPPNDHLVTAIHDLDQNYGPLPITLRTWFEVVGQVDLVGDHPKLSCFYGDGPASDPLVVGFDESGIEVQLDMREDDPELVGTPFYVEISPDAHHKSNYSGGGPNAFELPQAGFDGKLSSDDEWDGMYFIPYLRRCFAWGGFPALANDPPRAEAAAEEIAFLTKDLLPF